MKIKGMELLGLKVKDMVTGAEGVITSISYDLYGCIQGLLSPGADEKGKLGDNYWFDTKRLTILDSTPVMAVPTFEKVPGGQKLPPQNRY